MESIEYYAHKARYNYSYLKAEYLRKYYSDNKNPRIIPSKLTDKLISLRTFPVDKYLIKPGQFLSTHPHTVNSAPDDLDQSDLEELELNPLQPVVSHDQSPLQQQVLTQTCLRDLQNLPESPEAVPQSIGEPSNKYMGIKESYIGDMVTTGSSDQVSQELDCGCACHKPLGEPLNFCDNSSTKMGAKNLKSAKIGKLNKWWSFIDSSKKKLSEIPLIPSPIIEINSASLPEEPIQMIDNTKENIPQLKPQPQKINPPNLNFNTRRYSYTEGTNSHDVWRNLPSNISLLAAKASAGSQTTLDLISMYDY